MDKRRIKKLLLGELSVRRVVRSMILIPLYIYVALFFIALFFSDRLIFQPPPASYQDTDGIMKLTTKGGMQISAIHLVNEKAKYTILYSHGNAEDIGDTRPVLDGLKNLGFSVFTYDYQGYGTSQGRPSESNAYMDVEAAYEYLTAQLGIPGETIILYGHSLGGALAVDLASRKPVAGVIIESAFTTAFRVITRIPILPFDKFRNIDKLQHLTCPVLIIHGRQDKVIAVDHGQKLFEGAREPKQMILVDQAGHEDAALLAPKRLVTALQEFGFVTKGF
jgi:abhydrolase domain-containing protein 17